MQSDKEINDLAIDDFKILNGALEPFLNNSVFEPFNDDTLALLSELSSRLLSREVRNIWPDLAAFGSWIRPSNLFRLKTRFEEIEKVSGGLLAPRGSSLQFSPSNVEALFAYSWALALLSGCPTVVRVSSRRGAMTDVLLSQIRFAQEAVGATSTWAFTDYPRELTDISELLSRKSKVTVIWGGDDSVRKLRELSHGADSRIIAFPDRDSLSVINVASYLELDEEGKNRLVRLFGRDVFTFGQQACSSPRRLVWVGDSNCDDARSDFRDRLATLVTPLRDLETVERLKVMTYTHAIASTSSESMMQIEKAGDFTILTGEGITAGLLPHPGLGILEQHLIVNLGSLPKYLNSRDQTLTYFGFSKERWQGWIAENYAYAPLRVVPIGEALDFDSTWDGLDLLREFSKTISLH